MKQKHLLFSVTIKDCTVQTFRCGGHGGQNVNKVESGVRIIHPPSGAMVRCCDTRDQYKNKRIAFRRLVESKEFKAWHAVETARLLTQDRRTVEERVEESMAAKNLKVEGKDADGKWTELRGELS